MRRPRPPRLPLRLLALLVSLLALALPAGAHAFVVGVGEQQPYMFADPRFQALGLRYARLSVGWNALESRAESRALETWLRAARADGVHPLIAFEHSWIAHRHRRLPSAAQFARQFRALHARYPWVTDFATWNEANYCGQPTCHSPALVAAYYAQMRRLCPTCEVLGAEVLDVPDMVTWVREERRALGHEPEVWGLHNYIGANRFSTASTRALLGATSAPLWFTETAGVVARHNHSAHDFPESPAHAAAVTRFVFERLARLSGRIARVYLYQWDSGPHSQRQGPSPWDSALIGPHGTPRPAFWVLVRELHTLGRLPATPAASALLASARRAGG
jgi:polysaccharide biosynthesis protein PslG